MNVRKIVQYIVLVGIIVLGALGVAWRQVWVNNTRTSPIYSSVANNSQVNISKDKETSQLKEKVQNAIGTVASNLEEHLKDQPKEETNVEQIDYSSLVFTDYYSVLGKALFMFPVEKEGTVKEYSLDNLGRPTGASATLTYDLVAKERKEDREDIKVNPLGWVDNKKVQIIEENGDSYKGYFYNRSHLLADSLGGSARLENLVTGTRTQNVGIKNQGGMAYTEEKARAFFKEPTNEVLVYQVKPVYVQDEIVPRYVIVAIQSSDKAIDETVVVSNTANGYTIDYHTGKWYKN